MIALLMAAVAVASYLIGSIPTGYIIGRLVVGRDVLQHGSKRTGATNVLRIGGWKAGLAVALGDMAKGAVAVVVARWIAGIDPTADLIAGLFAMLGHNYSLFIGFKGGRGVAVGAAATMVMAPVTGLISALVFVIVIAATRYVSLGSILGAVSVPVTLLVLVVWQNQPVQHLIYAIIGCAFVIYSHRDNITRLRDGTERKLSGRIART